MKPDESRLEKVLVKIIEGLYSFVKDVIIYYISVIAVSHRSICCSSMDDHQCSELKRELIKSINRNVRL
jgi:hypothetical protein